jgi:hypothetical protein
MPSPTVKIAFDLTLAGGGDFFTIGATPIGGTAISGAFPIAGDVLTDITADVRSITTRRGRSRETDKFDAGSATIVVDNRDRKYDPAAGTAVTPYAPSLKPRKALTVDAAGQAIFAGQVEDIDLDYNTSGDNLTIFKASDGFTLLNQVNLTPGTATSELTGARVVDVLNDAGWPTARRDLDTGEATLGADVIGDRVNALDYLNQIAASEPGSVFIARDGRFAFRDRISPQVPTGFVFSDDGVGIPFTDLAIEYGTERLFTSIEVVYNGGTATASNAAAELEYGVNVLNVNTLLSNLDQAQTLADFYAGKFSAPLVRINALSVIVDALTPVQQGQVLSLDLGDQVSVQFTPNGIGDPIVQNVAVESIEHQISPALHSVRLTLSQTLAGFILDSSKLDEDTLGF